ATARVWPSTAACTRTRSERGRSQHTTPICAPAAIRLSREPTTIDPKNSGVSSGSTVPFHRISSGDSGAVIAPKTWASVLAPRFTETIEAGGGATELVVAVSATYWISGAVTVAQRPSAPIGARPPPNHAQPLV